MFGCSSKEPFQHSLSNILVNIPEMTLVRFMMSDYDLLCCAGCECNTAGTVSEVAECGQVSSCSFKNDKRTPAWQSTRGGSKDGHS